jgi:glycosyltransferase involved in cell wall biosynthesis
MLGDSPMIGTKPLITIGATSFNAADTIGRAIDSALSQDWREIEVLIVDDCSTDDSWSLLQSRAAADTRIRILRHEQNTGVAGARQTILDNARGEFLAFFDDDDDNAPDRLAAQYTRIVDYESRTGAGLVFCYCDRAVVKSGQSAPDHIGFAIGRTAPEPHGEMVADFILGVDAPSPFSWGLAGSCTIMARRSAYLTVGGFDPAFRRCGELDLAIRAALLGAHFIAVNRPLVTMYKTAGPDKAGSIPLKYALLLRDKHRAYLDRRGVYRASRMFARSNFWGNKKQMLKSRFYGALGYALAPQLLPSYLRRRSSRAG